MGPNQGFLIRKQKVLPQDHGRLPGQVLGSLKMLWFEGKWWSFFKVVSSQFLSQFCAKLYPQISAEIFLLVALFEVKIFKWDLWELQATGNWT